ncbi:MAG: hypothetical protein H6Q65_471 [Firmicutes bacterium]|nr:hypothetical protein [Bacillota bacterium]
MGIRDAGGILCDKIKISLTDLAASGKRKQQTRMRQAKLSVPVCCFVEKREHKQQIN